MFVPSPKALKASVFVLLYSQTCVCACATLAWRCALTIPSKMPPHSRWQPLPWAPLPGFVQANKWQSASNPPRRASYRRRLQQLTNERPVRWLRSHHGCGLAPRLSPGRRCLACGAWHAEEHTVKPRAEKGISHRTCFRSYQMYDLQFRGAIHSFPPCHPSPLPISNHPLSLLASFWRLNPSVRPVFFFFYHPHACPILHFSSRCARANADAWHHGAGVELSSSTTSFLIPIAPFAHARARPRSSPDWMAPCQPATAIALICSSSCSCPSPCIYISIPLSFSRPIHPVFTTPSPPLNTPVCKHSQRLHMCYFLLLR